MNIGRFRGFSTWRKGPVSLPHHVDWRETKGVLSPIKDQGNTGRCAAFYLKDFLQLFGNTKNSSMPNVFFPCNILVYPLSPNSVPYELRTNQYGVPFSVPYPTNKTP
ncbi:hypothetical protein P8452_43587 [Trifolium repens]|nr:hypothetical protein P8452_43587 [Trifolium repens]